MKKICNSQNPQKPFLFLPFRYSQSRNRNHESTLFLLWKSVPSSSETPIQLPPRWLGWNRRSHTSHLGSSSEQKGNCDRNQSSVWNKSPHSRCWCSGYEHHHGSRCSLTPSNCRVGKETETQWEKKVAYTCANERRRRSHVRQRRCLGKRSRKFHLRELGW